MVVPPFEHSLAGITVQRMMALLPEVRGGARGLVARAGCVGGAQVVAAAQLRLRTHAPRPARLQAIAGGIEGIRGLEQRPLSVEEAKAAREVFLVGSSLPVMPVVQVRCAAPRRAAAGSAGPCLRCADGCEAACVSSQRTLLLDTPTSPSPSHSPAQWDGTTIGDGTAGLGALQLRVMLQEDAKPREGGDQHTEVPYGYLTGML